MTVQKMQQEILRLKKEKDICILAHAYQSQAVLEVADFVGDSYGLSLEAAKVPQKGVLMCGVRFMAETCKILNAEAEGAVPRLYRRGLYQHDGGAEDRERCLRDQFQCPADLRRSGK